MTTDLTTYEPSSALDMMRTMDRMLNRVFGPSMWTNDDAYEGTLPVDISETENEVIVRASLPGYRREEIDVQFHQGMLSIKANHDWSEVSAGERFHRRERATGPLSRRIALPGIVHDSEVNAELRDGVLTLRIPVPEQARPRRIPISGSDHERPAEA